MPSKRKNIVLGTAYGIKEFPVSEKKHENGLDAVSPKKWTVKTHEYLPFS